MKDSNEVGSILLTLGLVLKCTVPTAETILQYVKAQTDARIIYVKSDAGKLFISHEPPEVENQ